MISLMTHHYNEYAEKNTENPGETNCDDIPVINQFYALIVRFLINKYFRAFMAEQQDRYPYFISNTIK